MCQQFKALIPGPEEKSIYLGLCELFFFQKYLYTFNIKSLNIFVFLPFERKQNTGPYTVGKKIGDCFRKSPSCKPLKRRQNVFCLQVSCLPSLPMICALPPMLII